MDLWWLFRSELKKFVGFILLRVPVFFFKYDVCVISVMAEEGAVCIVLQMLVSNRSFNTAKLIFFKLSKPCEDIGLSSLKIW